MIKLSEHFANLSDMFNMTARDWCHFFNAIEDEPPVKRRALYHNDEQE